MSKNKTIAQSKVDDFADDIKRQFEDIGNEVKEQLIKDFDKILTNDLDGLKELLIKFVKNKSNNILKNSSVEFNDIVNNDFDGSIFGSILSDAILSNINNGNLSSNSSSRNFRPSSNQKFVEIGKALSRSRSKNGQVMVWIKMLQTRKGTEDGFVVRQFYKGCVYEVQESLARSFFADGYAERA